MRLLWIILRDYDLVLTFKISKEFEIWLENHHETTPSIWIRMYKSGSGKTGITYDGALDAALCFGWIDGIAKKYDDISYVQRFTPRRPKGNWSKRNTEHIARLLKAGRMKPSGMVQVELAKKDGRWQRAYDSAANAAIPEDFIREIEKNEKIKAFFDTLNRSNLYAIAYRLQTAKKPETLQRRKEAILQMLEKGKKFH